MSILLIAWSITEDVYFVDRLKNNLLSVAQLVCKGYHLQFTEKTSTIKGRNGKLIRTGTRTKGNVFQLSPTEISCLVARIDDSW